uniref:(northern house mosquito) hypothetical protein n=1 Tax=Culex pipiens TaxID=7175 RepID=A0A8D8GR26_CULPI
MTWRRWRKEATWVTCSSARWTPFWTPLLPPSPSTTSLLDHRCNPDGVDLGCHAHPLPASVVPWSPASVESSAKFFQCCERAPVSRTTQIKHFICGTLKKLRCFTQLRPG